VARGSQVACPSQYAGFAAVVAAPVEVWGSGAPRPQAYFLEEDRTGTLACLSFSICWMRLLMK
jgi:hypothetical protein